MGHYERILRYHSGKYTCLDDCFAASTTSRLTSAFDNPYVRCFDQHALISNRATLNLPLQAALVPAASRPAHIPYTMYADWPKIQRSRLPTQATPAPAVQPRLSSQPSAATLFIC